MHRHPGKSYAFRLQRIRPLVWLGLMLPGWSSAAVVTGVDEQSGLRSWEWREAGASIRLVQRLPDQTRAFFQARGFSVAEADRIASECVFQTIFRNDGQYPLTYALDDWRILHRGERRSLLTRERWDEIWRGGQAGKAARIALHWSLLPTRQRFEPGDYNWGMSSFGLQPGSSFDLEIVVTLDRDTISRSISGIECARDLQEN